MSQPENKNKLFIVYALTAIVFVAILYQWFKIAPYKTTDNRQDTTWQEINQRFSQAFESIRADFETAKYQVNDVQNEVVRQTKQAELLQEAKKYIANLNTSTPTTTPK